MMGKTPSSAPSDRQIAGMGYVAGRRLHGERMQTCRGCHLRTERDRCLKDDRSTTEDSRLESSFPDPCVGIAGKYPLGKRPGRAGSKSIPCTPYGDVRHAGLPPIHPGFVSGPTADTALLLAQEGGLQMTTILMLPEWKSLRILLFFLSSTVGILGCSSGGQGGDLSTEDSAGDDTVFFDDSKDGTDAWKPVPDGLLRPEDFEYRGAFRLPPRQEIPPGVSRGEARP